MSYHRKSLLSVMATAGLVLAGTLSAEMLPQNKRAQVLYPTKMVVSRPLRDIPPPVVKATAAHEVANKTTPLRPAEPGTSANIQTTPGVPNTPDPLAGWQGLKSSDNETILGTGLMPPDTQGDIGKDHYIQWNNLVFAIWDKAGTKVYPAQPGPVAALPIGTVAPGIEVDGPEPSLTARIRDLQRRLRLVEA